MSSLSVVDGMKRPSFTVKIDVASSTVADLFREVAKSYKLELDPIKNLRIIFADKELKYTRKTTLRKVDIIDNSTIAVIFRLPDVHPKTSQATIEEADVAVSEEVKIDEENEDAEEAAAITAPAPVKIDEESRDAIDVAESTPAKAKKKSKKKKQKDVKIIPPLEITADSLAVMTDKENREADDIPAANSEPVKAKKKRIRNKRKTGKEEEKRPALQDMPEILALTYDADFLDFDPTQCRAKLPPCSHVMVPPDCCKAEWKYRHVRHVACFTTKEMHSTEKTIAINLLGKDSSVLTCPGCFTWCSKVDSKQTRLRCFVCTKATGEEFLFCGYCLREWKNTRSGRCANPTCTSIEATLEILRNAPTASLHGGQWLMIRLCPRCGILTEFVGGCTQIHCQLCQHDYCFVCLKGAKCKAGLRCTPYNSTCQIAPPQTSIPEWDGRNSD